MLDNVLLVHFSTAPVVPYLTALDRLGRLRPHVRVGISIGEGLCRVKGLARLSVMTTPGSWTGLGRSRSVGTANPPGLAKLKQAQLDIRFIGRPWRDHDGDDAPKMQPRRRRRDSH